MTEPIYKVDELLQRLLDLLRKQKKALSRDQVKALLALPDYAVDAALEAAMLGGRVVYAAGEGYWIEAVGQ